MVNWSSEGDTRVQTVTLVRNGNNQPTNQASMQAEDSGRLLLFSTTTNKQTNKRTNEWKEENTLGMHAYIRHING